MRPSIALTGSTLAAIAVCAAAQAPAPQFRTSVDLVRISVTVLDREGRPAHGLSRLDFQVFEDDSPRPIEAFSEVRLRGATEPGPFGDVPADVQNNQAALDGRVVVIVMDDAIVPASPRIKDEAQRLARQIVEGLGPSDQAAVVFTLDSRAAQGLTTDRTRLLAAIDAFRPVGATQGRSDLSDWHYYQGSIGTLSQLADLLARIPDRRKALALISVGVPFDATAAASPHAMPERPTPANVVALAPGEMQRDLLFQTRLLLAKCQRLNVAIYALDPTGLSVGLKPGGEYLRTIAASTGGLAATEGVNPTEAIGRMLDETGSYYLLGYRVEGEERGRSRTVRIEANRDGFTVRAPTARIAMEGAAASDAARDVEATLARALAGIVPASALPMSVNVIPFGLPGERDAVLAIAARLRQPPPDRRTVERVELRVSAYDTNGRQRASKRQRAEVALLPADTEAEYEVLTQMRVRPGRYSLRLAGHRTSAGETGSVFYDIDVPDFANADLVLSGIALTASPGVLAAPRDALSDILPILPTTQRQFDPAEHVTAFVRVYRGRRGPRGAVTLDVRVLSGDKSSTFEESRTFQVTDFVDTGSVEHRVRLPMQALEPGTYVVSVRATAGEVVATRMVTFGVR